MNPQHPILDSHPAICASNVGYHVTDRLKAGTIHLYSAYLIMHETLRLERRCYTHPAWRQKLRIRGLIRIYYDYLTALALKCPAEAAESANWFTGDIPLLQERRAHFLVARLPEGRALLDDRSFHTLLSELRRDYDRLSDDDGPFPPEVFPYHYAAPEREILHPGSEAPFQCGQELDPESSDLYVQLHIGGA